MNSLNIFLNIFKCLCVLATSFMVGYWVFKYGKNHDVTIIEYKSLGDIPDFMYPELSICLLNPFFQNKSLNITAEYSFSVDYAIYLKGNSKFERYKDVKYEDVVIDLAKYFERLTIGWILEKRPSNYTDCRNLNTCSYATLKNNYNGFSQTGHFFKCFGIQVNKNIAKDVLYYRITFDKSLSMVLPQIRSTNIRFNYPNQIVRPSGGTKSIWHKTSGGKVDVFEITSVDLLKRRNKQNAKCTDQWHIFDTLVLKRHIESSGCRPPYISEYAKFPICKTMKDIKHAYYDGWSLEKKYVDDPCQEMPTIDFKSYDRPIARFRDTPDEPKILVYFPFKGKIISQLQEVDVHSLIGNIGGYIGLFLGKIL